MRKPSQGFKTKSSASANSSEKIGTYDKAMGMPSLSYRTCMNKVNKNPQDGESIGFGTSFPTIMK